MRSVTLVLAVDKVDGEVELASRDLENGRSAEHAPASAANCCAGALQAVSLQVQMACRPACTSRLSSNTAKGMTRHRALNCDDAERHQALTRQHRKDY